MENNCAKFEMTIGHDLFLETLLLRIQGETIKFASVQKKNISQFEKQLLFYIENLEAKYPICTLNSILLLDKKAELESIRGKKNERSIC